MGNAKLDTPLGDQLMCALREGNDGDTGGEGVTEGNREKFDAEKPSDGASMAM